MFEDINVKQETFALLEDRCRPDCIFCTNSSVMSPSWISEKLTHRERFVGTHFWNPGHLIPLVEVVKTDATDDETAETVMDFMRKIGKSPCLCKKDVPGFIANRMQHALWREAISIVENGIAWIMNRRSRMLKYRAFKITKLLKKGPNHFLDN